MKTKAVLGIMLTLLLTNMLTLAFKIQPAKASGTVYIRADGSVDPPTAPIQRVGDLYTFTDNIYDSIVVERNSIVIDGNGYTLQGTGAFASKGIDLTGRSKVTIKNTRITVFYYGIWLYVSSNNIISGNNITANNGYGIWLEDSSSSNSISGNNITANNSYGIWLYVSSNNIISGNNITANNSYGIELYYSYNNIIYHNNFIDNSQQVRVSPSYANVWDDGYPSGGNYWSDYAGIDVYSGQHQNVSGTDGIGDTAYEIDANNQDNYPLMNPLDVARPHIPITDPSIPKFPYRLSIEPAAGEWKTNVTYEATLFDIMGRSFDLLAMIAYIPGVDIAVKTWDFILMDKDGDEKITPEEAFEQLNEALFEKLTEQMILLFQTYSYQISLSAAQLASLANLEVLSILMANAFTVATIARVATLSLGGTSSVGVPSVVIDPRLFLTFFGIQDVSLEWTVNGIVGDGKAGVHSLCPVDLIITDELGRVVNKTLSEIPGASYLERDLDGDGDLDDFIDLPTGNQSYSLKVVPELGANPNDTYTLIVGSDWIGYTLEENSTIQEISETGYNITTYERITVPDISIANVTPSKTIVGEGLTLSLDVVVENQGDYREIFNVTAYADKNVAVIGDEITIGTKNGTLTSGNLTTVTFRWNTTGVEKGNYTITAIATPIPGETDIADNNRTYGKVLVTIAGDVNGDGKVDAFDLFNLSKVYGSIPADLDCDLNADGEVDASDLSDLNKNYGKSF